MAATKSTISRPRAYYLPENKPSCSIKRSRIAREIIIHEITAAMEKISSSSYTSKNQNNNNNNEMHYPKYKITMAPKCILNVSNSIYHKLETNTKEYAQRYWRDRISGKLFRNEDYLDLYLYKKYFINHRKEKNNNNNTEEDEANPLFNPQKQTICLSKYCDKLLNGCYDINHDMDRNKHVHVRDQQPHYNHQKDASLYLKENKISCSKKSIHLRKQHCLKIFHSCFTIVRTTSNPMTLPIGTNNINKKQQEQSLIKLLHYYDKTFCEYDICNNGPRNMMENIGTYGTHSSLNNPRTYFAFFFKTFGGMFLVVLFTLIVSVFAYMYYSEKQAIVLNNDLRKIRKKWSARGKSD